MKPKFKIMLLFVVGNFLHLNAEQPVLWEFAHSFRSSLKNVYVLGADTVYVVGELGLIAQSPDKGKNWNTQRFSYHLYDTLNDIYFVTSETGFVVGANGVILKTVNSGKTWINCNSGTTQDLKSIYGTGINNIWTVGNKGTVLKSNDGGQTWNPISITNKTPDFSDVGFKNEKGYIIGSLGSVFKTVNNGDYWSQQTNIEDYTGSERFKCLTVTESKAFMNSDYNATIHIFNNDLWQKIKLPKHDDYAYDELYSSCFLNDKQGYVAGILYMITTGSSYGCGYIYIYKTDNGGLNWSLSSSGSNNPVALDAIIGGFDAKMSFVNSDTGYLISDSRIYRIPFVGDIDAGFYDNINTTRAETKIILKQNENFLDIEYRNEHISTVKLISLSGQTIYQQKNNPNNKEIRIAINNFKKGIYIIEINLKDNNQMWIKWVNH